MAHLDQTNMLHHPSGVHFLLLNVCDAIRANCLYYVTGIPCLLILTGCTMCNNHSEFQLLWSLLTLPMLGYDEITHKASVVIILPYFLSLSANHRIFALFCYLPKFLTKSVNCITFSKNIGENSLLYSCNKFCKLCAQTPQNVPKPCHFCKFCDMAIDSVVENPKLCKIHFLSIQCNTKYYVAFFTYIIY